VEQRELIKNCKLVKRNQVLFFFKSKIMICGDVTFHTLQNFQVRIS
jgi:ribosomal protein L36